MKNVKTILALLLAIVMVFSIAACAETEKEAAGQETQDVQDNATNDSEGVKNEAPNDSKDDAPDSSGDDNSAEEVTEQPIEQPIEQPAEIRVGSLKGPTTMGIVALMERAENGETLDSYTFKMETDASAVAAGVVSGDIDIALIPANLAAVLYKRTEGGISVIDVNTLGVLYCVTGDESITGIRDLAGKTVILTGQGTTPEYALRYLLAEYGVEDCSLEFKSEAAEAAAVLAADPTRIAVLPQPFATAAQVQNDALLEAFSLTEEWDAVSDGSRLLTGVTAVRKAFLEEHPDAVRRFMAEHKDSVAADNAEKAALAVKYGIIEKEPVANLAIPKCGITYIDGAEMKAALEGYLGVLYAADPSAVGGAMPADDFYYVD